jgi:hypothetical protein
MNTSRQAELAEKSRYSKQHLSDWAQIGLTQIKYCRRHELNRHRYHYWKKKFQKQQSAFIELQFSGKKPQKLAKMPHISLVGCWANVRLKFIEVIKAAENIE